jgi:hypothetical protein
MSNVLSWHLPTNPLDPPLARWGFVGVERELLGGQILVCLAMKGTIGERRSTMITELSREKLVELGSRNRADYLVQQAGYTLGLAALDGKALSELLPDGFTDEVNAALSKVNAARQDKALMAEESKEATRGQNEAFKKAKVWRRRVAKRAGNAVAMGKVMPSGLTHISQARTVPALQAQVTEMAKLLEANLSLLHGAGLDKLLEEGKALGEALRAKDAAQEVKRLKELPESVKEFYAQKAILYTGLKIINNAGHELYADAPAQAAKYNMAILNRHGKHGGAEDGDISTPKPPETKA